MITLDNATNLLLRAVNNLVEQVQPDSWRSDPYGDGGSFLHYDGFGSVHSKGALVWLSIERESGDTITNAELASIITKKAEQCVEDARRKKEQAIATARMKAADAIINYIDSRTNPLPPPAP